MVIELPHSTQAENALIAMAWENPESLHDIDLPADAFYHRANQIVWETLQDMLVHGESIDTITLMNRVENDGNLLLIGGDAKFRDYIDTGYIRSNMNDYVDLIRDDWTCRRILGVLEDGIRMACEGNPDASDVLGKLAGIAISDQSDISLEEHGLNFIDDCKSGEYGRFRWWCDEWTCKLGRMTSDLIILHAPRSTGKTAMMLQWITGAHSMGQRTPLASIEMLKKELAPRLIANLGQVGTFMMRVRGSVTFDEESRSVRAIETLRKLNLCVRDKAMTIDDICAWAIREKQRGVDAVFIDNLLSISMGSGRFESKTIFYDHCIRRLRDLRDQLGCPIILLAHPNQEGLIAWSRDVENFADIIIYLQEVPSDGIGIKSSGKTVAKNYNVNGKHVLATFQKNRNGIYPLYASLDFIGETQSFNHIEWVE